MQPHILAVVGEPFRWRDGQSGNPGGRPKNPIGADIRAFLEELTTLKSGEQHQRKLVLIRKMFHLAVMDGDMIAGRLLLEYGYGKPTQPVELDDASLRTWAEAVALHFDVDTEEVLRRYKDKEQFRAAQAG